MFPAGGSAAGAHAAAPPHREKHCVKFTPTGGGGGGLVLTIPTLLVLFKRQRLQRPTLIITSGAVMLLIRGFGDNVATGRSPCAEAGASRWAVQEGGSSEREVSATVRVKLKGKN